MTIAVIFALWFVGCFLYQGWKIRNEPDLIQIRPPEGRVNDMGVDAARRLGWELLSGVLPRIWWGRVPLRPKDAKQGFLVIGKAGSGKTITIKLLMTQVLPALRSGQRALIYDSKNDSFSFLCSLGLSPVTMNPFDARRRPWNIAADVKDEDTARAVAQILIPENKNENNPHFSDTARNLVSGVMTAFAYSAPDEWDLRDVQVAIRSPKRLKEVLSSCPHTTDLVDLHFHEDSTEFKSVLSTLSTHMQKYNTVAASWWSAKQKGIEPISLGEWANGDKNRVLLIGKHSGKRATMDPINRVLLSRIQALLVDPAQTTSSEPRTWLFLDELASMGRLDGLKELGEQGRQFGVSLVVGCQTVDQLYDIYGRHATLAMLGNYSNAALLKVTTEETAKFCSGLIGDKKYMRRKVSETYGRHGSTTNIGVDHVREPVVLPSAFQSLPPTDARHGLTGFYISDSAIWKATTPVQDWPAEKSEHPEPDFVPTAPEDHVLEPWNDEDRARLKLLPTQLGSIEEGALSDLFSGEWLDEGDEDDSGPNLFPT